MSVSNTIAHKKTQQLYRRKGNRYIPVNDPYAYDGLREGSWFVKVSPECTTIRAAIYPNHMEIQAALYDLEEKLVKLIGDAARARPKRTLLTPAEKAAWDKLIEIGGDEFNVLSYDSYQGIADTICGKVKERLVERGSLPRLDAEIGS